MKRPKLLISLIFILIVLLSVIRVSIENSISTTGIEIAELTQELEEFKKSNFKLEEKYLALTSLTQIASKAAALGFVKEDKTISLTTPLPLAIKP